jgi:hypothetical protein
VELQVVKAEMHDGNQWVEDVGATEEKKAGGQWCRHDHGSWLFG